MARVFLRKACRIEMAAQKVLVALAESPASAVLVVLAVSAASAVSVALAVLAAKEMVREASRRGKKVIIPLFPPHPSETQPHMVVFLPFWLADKGETVDDSGASGADGDSGAGLIGRDLLAVFLVAFCGVLALMAMVSICTD